MLNINKIIDKIPLIVSSTSGRIVVLIVMLFAPHQFPPQLGSAYALAQLAPRLIKHHHDSPEPVRFFVRGCKVQDVVSYTTIPGTLYRQDEKESIGPIGPKWHSLEVLPCSEI